MTKFSLSLAVLVLDDLGLELRASTMMKISTEETIAIANFYSPIAEASSAETGVYGPLPVPKYHEKFNVLVGLFEHYDSKIRNERALSKRGLARCFLLIFYDKKYDYRMSLAQNTILLAIESFFREIEDLSDLTSEQLQKLSDVISQEILEKEDNMRLRDIDDIISEIANRFNTIEMLSTTLDRRTTIGIISDDLLSYKIFIQSVFHLQNIDFVIEYSLSEWYTKIETCNAQYYLARLFDLETLAGLQEFKNLDYVLYIVPCIDQSQVRRHFRNLDAITSNNPDVSIIFITTNLAKHISIDIKKYLLEEEEKRPNVFLLVSIGNVYRSMENAMYKIVNDFLRTREMQLSNKN